MVTEISNTALNALENSALSMNQVTNFSVKVRIIPSSYAHLMGDNKENYSPFRPGMSATVDIITSTQKDVLSIPIKAVTTRTDTASNHYSKYKKDKEEEDVEEENEEDLICVFVYENGKARVRLVETGIQDTKYIQIKGGLKEDDQVITGPYDEIAKKLKGGKMVEIKVEKEDESEEEEEEE